jgi:hypothetical protein
MVSPDGLPAINTGISVPFIGESTLARMDAYHPHFIEAVQGILELDASQRLPSAGG